MAARGFAAATLAASFPKLPSKRKRPALALPLDGSASLALRSAIARAKLPLHHGPHRARGAGRAVPDRPRVRGARGGSGDPGDRRDRSRPRGGPRESPGGRAVRDGNPRGVRRPRPGRPRPHARLRGAGADRGGIRLHPLRARWHRDERDRRAGHPAPEGEVPAAARLGRATRRLRALGAGSRLGRGAHRHHRGTQGRPISPDGHEAVHHQRARRRPLHRHRDHRSVEGEQGDLGIRGGKRVPRIPRRTRGPEDGTARGTTPRS